MPITTDLGLKNPKCVNIMFISVVIGKSFRLRN